MSPPGRDAGSRLGAPWHGLALGLLALGALVRVNNAFRYKTRLGFDAVENVEYIERLMLSWALPAPDAAWATSHPPLFYYLSAALGRLFALFSREQWLLVAVPLLCGAASLAIGWMAMQAVRRLDPGNDRRAVIALALIVFLPVHVYMSAMVNEELLAALLASAVLMAALLHEPAAEGAARWRGAAGIGLLAGLALLTKLSGVLVMGAVAIAWLATGWRTGALRPAVERVAVMGAVALLVGGWFYARNLALYGWLYPQDLATHALMFEMPPGDRGVLDYLRFPLATFTDPQLLSPDLLHSVWGSTYATVYFDGHRHFLASSVAVGHVGTLLTLLGLLPCAAFVLGAERGARRVRSDPHAPDTMLLGLVALTLAGYVAFTWGNPWFATLKGSYLLGLSIPFAAYASGPLARWSERPGASGHAVWGMLAALVLMVALTFSFGLVFEKIDGAGLPWRDLATAR